MSARKWRNLLIWDVNASWGTISVASPKWSTAMVERGRPARKRPRGGSVCIASLCQHFDTYDDIIDAACDASALATPKPGAVGGGRCVGGPATAGPCPWGAARLAAARLRRFEVFGIGVRCCSVSAQRHAVSGSVPKARHRRFRCGRVPSRRTRLLVALERRGAGRLSDGERLHEPLGGRGEDLQNVETLLPRGRHDGPEERENPRALEGPEAAGDLHL